MFLKDQKVEDYPQQLVVITQMVVPRPSGEGFSCRTGKFSGWEKLCSNGTRIS